VIWLVAGELLGRRDVDADSCVSLRATLTRALAYERR